MRTLFTMKKISICSIILIFTWLSSCKSQIKSDLPKETTEQVKETKSDFSDYDPYFVETKYTTSPYGPNSITRNILQAKNGDIWLATWEGIIRYNGKSFTNFTNKENLRRHHVFCLLEDSRGNLWFGTIGAGVYRYDGKTFTNFTTNDGLANDRVGCIYEDRIGNIWIGTERGISCFNGSMFQYFKTDEGVNNNDVNSIVEDESGKLWIGTRGAAFIYDGKEFTKITNRNGDAFYNIRSIIKDKNGDMWLGGNGGLFRYNQSSFTNYTTNFVGYIFQDKKGNIWTSSASEGNAKDSALSRYDANSLKDKTIAPTIIKEEANMFFGIYEDDENGIWLGTLTGAFRYDGESFDDFKTKEKPKLKLAYIGNMGVLVESGDKTVLFDGFHKKYKPDYLFPSEEVVEQLTNGTYPDFSKIEIALFTHTHNDHFDADLSRAFLKKNPESHVSGTPKIYNTIGKEVERNIEFPFFNRSDIGISSIKLPHCFQSKHHAIQNLGFIAKMDDFKVMHLGDTEWELALPVFESRNYESVDVAIIPYWMLYKEESIKHLSILKAKKIIATHIPPNIEKSELQKLSSMHPEVTFFVEAGEISNFVK